MAKLIMNLAILVQVAAASMLLHTTYAADHTVGGATGWIIPPTASFYSTWASSATFQVNDTLVFNFMSGSHNVVELTMSNFENCNVDSNLAAFNTGPARVTLNRTGEYYFACAFTGHCDLGQKLAINVTSSTPPTKAPAGSPSSPAPAEGPSSTTVPGAPPPQGAAASVAATFSVLIITIAMNVLI